MVTIKDVAERAGVAPSTVSYVLSGSRKISPATVRSVRAAVEELGYHPNAGARTLRTTRTGVLALALPLRSGSYRAVDGRFIVDISDAARLLGYDILLTTAPDGEAGLRRIAGSRLADGAVLMTVEMDDPRIAAMRELSFPVALLGRPADDQHTPWADLDWEEAAATAVAACAAAGHRHVGYLATTDREIRARRSYAVRGIAGARRAAREARAAGLRLDVHRSTGDPDRLRARLLHLLAGPDRPTALVVQHASVLPQILQAVATAGLRLPDDLTLVAVGTLPDDLGGVDLTRIDLPVRQMAAEVTRLAVGAVEGNRRTPPATDDAAHSDDDSDAASPHALLRPVLTPGRTLAAPPTAPTR
ncbi:LacI family DNA-binding transcriptional regulator [Allostreptomyces psammosilenae]|uniref:DNA-binding LacI/PurR family transcriptional regulator n=1 Tax=Allostreptomyces psammosilenae TaxID=1892865 RepID=A0A852ZZT2_9ACTN|nr:LacI family DNA-binding transcriptional regulator [Allostreptomyces psammosilenae]NYI03638.1 DNA-binding LacI/PurR family transcriptional regulator [Allostreptomyces psammosilenae]